MADILNINQNKRKEIEAVRARIHELEPILGLERDEHSMSLSKASFNNEFAARRLEQIQSSHPIEWNEYCDLMEWELNLDEELGITESIMDELFPDEKDIDVDALKQETIVRILK